MSAKKREVEIKFRIRDSESLVHKLHACGFRLITPRTHEVNTLLDFPDRPLTSRGELLRIRKYGNTWKVTHKSKGGMSRHKSRMEVETAIGSGEALQTILATLGLVKIFRYEKYRAEWSDGKGHAVVDETPIGNFAEIEGPPRWIDATARRLGVPQAEYITQNYASLFHEWKRTTGSPAQEMTFEATRPKRSRSEK